MKTTDTMVLFWGNKDIYSNWHPSMFTDEDGIIYKNSEQYMMYKKAMLFGDTNIAKQVLWTSDPRKMKELGRRVKNFNEKTWAANRVQIMVVGCYLKFTQNKDMGDALLATGHKTIVEASPYDKIWGIGLGEEDPRALNPNQWDGHNLLGISLMLVRQKMVEEQNVE